MGKDWRAEIYQEALSGSPEQSAVLLKPKAHTAATLITQVSIETTSAARTGPKSLYFSKLHLSVQKRCNM